MKTLCIDAGGTAIKSAWIDELNNITPLSSVPTPKSKEEFFELVEGLFNSIDEPRNGIALSLPGVINPDTGYMYSGGALTYHENFEFKKYYEERLNVPIEIGNDARCAAMAELTSGNLKDVKNGLILTFGTGIGGCAIINNEIYYGSHLSSCEASVMMSNSVRELTPEQVYSQGIFAGAGSVPKLMHTMKAALNLDHTDGKIIMNMVKDNHPVAVEIFNKYCDDVIIYITNFQVVLDVERICLGGGISENPIFTQGIIDAQERLYSQLPLPIRKPEIMACKYFNNANLIGAHAYFTKKHPE